MGRLHASQRLTVALCTPGVDATTPLLDEGGNTGDDNHKTEGAEDKLRGVSVRHSCAFKGLDQRSRHTAQEGWAIDAGPSMNEASGQRICPDAQRHRGGVPSGRGHPM